MSGDEAVVIGRIAGALAVDFHKALHLGGDPRGVVAATADPDPEVSGPATEALIEAVRRAFELAPLDRDTGEGATEQHTLDAYAAFAEHCRRRAARGPAPVAAPWPG